MKRYPKTSRERFLTITSDNGAEFMNAEEVEAIGIIQFYTHSYCSWERGSNENNNRLIRRFIRKGKKLEEIKKEEIKEIERWESLSKKIIQRKKIYEKLFRKEQSKKFSKG